MNSKIDILTEKTIINKYLKKLNLNHKGTFNFENDAAYIKLKKNKKLVITTDSISENLDFFKYDDPKSIANKIVTINLSDLSAMGVDPYAYSLSLFLPNYINKQWLKIFTNQLLKLQKKYNFYLLGGDLSKSNKLSVSASFFGFAKRNKIINQNKINQNNDIWITGNLGDSYAGLQILRKKIKVNDKKSRDYFLKKYYYPKPCLIGSKIANHVKSMKDISDGFIGDLNKMLNNQFGASLDLNKLPTSPKLKKIINNNILFKKNIANCGDNYELIIISNISKRKNILRIANQNNLKISRIGKVTKKLGLQIDSKYLTNISREYDHFL